MTALAWYGDDFTGATDTLATLARAGRRARLFLGVPDTARLAASGELEAIGIAGATRALSASAMRAELAPAAAFLAGLDARFIHYKCCSTFDSAPDVGNLAVAMRTLAEATADDRPLLIVGGQPNLGRYCVFGTLFAAYRTGGEVFRLDRHPTMSRHPVTPMHEADLRRHLATLGMPDVSSWPITDFDLPDAARQQRFESHCATAPLLVDIADDRHLVMLGRLLWSRSTATSVWLLGPTGVEQALLAAWPALPVGAPSARDFGAARGPVLAWVGSLSPVSAEQVAFASSYHRVELDPGRLLGAGQAALDAAVARLTQPLQTGHHVLATWSGPSDPRVGQSGRDLAALGGRLLNAVLRAVPAVRRIGIAGGDTSSLATQALDVWALDSLGYLAPGVALCVAASDAPRFDGLELMLKGGQMGPIDLFERLITGRALAD